MSYGSNRGSRHSTGRGRGKVRSAKGKRKGQKHRSGGKYLLGTSEAPTSEEAVEKTFDRLSNLAGQTFAFSPFSQYFGDWLLSLKSVLSEFESNPAIEVDETFLEKRSQVITDVEFRLFERQSEEEAIQEIARKLAKQKTLLVQTDTEYSYSTQKLTSERKGEIKRLTHMVNEVETELEETQQTKVSIFSPLARRARSQKEAEVNWKLEAAKTELESAIKALEADQKKLYSTYEKKKQAIMDQVQIMEKKVSGSEIDGSAGDRQAACEKLSKAVKALLKRKMFFQ